MNKELREFLDDYSAQHLYELAALRQMFTKNSQPVRGALAIPIGAATGGVALLSTIPGRLVGWALKETTGANPAELDLLDGRSVDGDLLAPIALQAGQSVRDWFGPAGISFTSGLFADVISGAITGTVWLGRIDT